MNTLEPEIPSPGLVTWIDDRASVASASGFSRRDLSQHFTPENDPEVWGLKFERQRMNDCQANALTTGMEIIEWRFKKKRAELSRMCAYQQSEIINGWLGRNRGTSIAAGCKVAMTIGVPTEAEYPYTQYSRSRRKVAEWFEPYRESASERVIYGALRAPSFMETLAWTVTGNPLHFAINWPVEMDSNRVVNRYKHGRGAHALCGVYPHKTRRGEWRLKVYNSHGDPPLYIREDPFEEMRDESPYGFYILQGHKKPFEQHVFL